MMKYGAPPRLVWRFGYRLSFIFLKVARRLHAG